MEHARAEPPPDDQSGGRHAGERPAWQCPHCGAGIDPAAAPAGDRPDSIQCPGCGAALARPGPLDYALPATPDDRQGDFAEELDGLRIRQVATLRRGAARARSYLVIGAAVSVVAAVKLVSMAVEYVRANGWGPSPVGYLMFAAAALLLAGYFGRRALEAHRELKTPPPLPPQPAEPDFSTLSDGSQRWKNLEDLR
jgi:hypothetical protein